VHATGTRSAVFFLFLLLEGIMTVQRGLLTIGAAVGLLVGLNALIQPQEVVAQEDSEELISNPVIDCSTNRDFYDNKFVKIALRTGGGNVAASNQNCNSCHKGASPRQNTGDKPVPEMGNTIIQNHMQEAVNYSIKYGKGPWKEFELEPGKVQRHSYEYAHAGVNKSPPVFIKYKKDAKSPAEERQLTLVATPNKRIGSLYFFDENDKGQLAMWEPGAQPIRARDKR